MTQKEIDDLANSSPVKYIPKSVRLEAHKKGGITIAHLLAWENLRMQIRKQLGYEENHGKE